MPLLPLVIESCKISNKRTRVSNTIMYTLTNTEPLVHLVRKRQLGFLGHILRLPEEEAARRYALYIPPHDKRKPGRPRTSYLAYIQRLLGYNEDELLADQITTPQPKDDDDDDFKKLLRKT